MELKQRTLGPSFPIQRFPEDMTGRKYRKSLGLSVTRKYDDKSFKIKHKFLCIKHKDRLKFLKKMAIIVAKPCITTSVNSPEDMRCLFDLSKGECFPLTNKCPCYVCGGHADVRHHVITLQHGGRNKNNNIVPLCYLCHSKVHPHLRNLNQMRKVASRHSVQPKINGPLVTTQGINNIIVAVKGA